MSEEKISRQHIQAKKQDLLKQAEAKKFSAKGLGKAMDNHLIAANFAQVYCYLKPPVEVKELRLDERLQAAAKGSASEKPKSFAKMQAAANKASVKKFFVAIFDKNLLELQPKLRQDVEARDSGDNLLNPVRQVIKAQHIEHCIMDVFESLEEAAAKPEGEVSNEQFRQKKLELLTLIELAKPDLLSVHQSITGSIHNNDSIEYRVGVILRDIFERLDILHTSLQFEKIGKTAVNRLREHIESLKHKYESSKVCNRIVVLPVGESPHIKGKHNDPETIYITSTEEGLVRPYRWERGYFKYCPILPKDLSSLIRAFAVRKEIAKGDPEFNTVESLCSFPPLKPESLPKPIDVATANEAFKSLFAEASKQEDKGGLPAAPIEQFEEVIEMKEQKDILQKISMENAINSCIVGIKSDLKNLTTLNGQSKDVVERQIECFSNNLKIYLEYSKMIYPEIKPDTSLFFWERRYDPKKFSVGKKIHELYERLTGPMCSSKILSLINKKLDGPSAAKLAQGILTEFSRPIEKTPDENDIAAIDNTAHPGKFTDALGRLSDALEKPKKEDKKSERPDQAPAKGSEIVQDIINKIEGGWVFGYRFDPTKHGGYLNLSNQEKSELELLIFSSMTWFIVVWGESDQARNLITSSAFKLMTKENQEIARNLLLEAQHAPTKPAVKTPAAKAPGSDQKPAPDASAQKEASDAKPSIAVSAQALPKFALVAKPVPPVKEDAKAKLSAAEEQTVQDIINKIDEAWQQGKSPNLTEDGRYEKLSEPAKSKVGERIREGMLSSIESWSAENIGWDCADDPLFEFMNQAQRTAVAEAASKSPFAPQEPAADAAP